MNRQLWEILSKERHKAHKFSKDEGFAKQIEGVVNAEGVKNGGQEHVLSNERCKAGAFQVWLNKSVAFVVPN